jgi:hypothetical protein
MKRLGLLVAVACTLLVAEPIWIAHAAPSSSAFAQEVVPGDLKPLLAPPASEMRLVVTRYAQDRQTLSGNYAGGAGRGGGRGGGGRGGGQGAAPAAAAPSGPVSLSQARIARLKRFDLSWQAAIGKIDPNKLTVAGRADLADLRAALVDSASRLLAQDAELTWLTTVVPFMPKIVQYVEARIRIDEMNAERTARTATELIKDIARVKARLEAGLANAGTSDALRINQALALRAAEAVDALRANTTEWFNFYNGYDPMFTWWMGLPYKKLDAALQDYATFLRDKVAPANLSAPESGMAAMAAKFTPTPPAPAPKFAEVPDLSEIIALPQDEMRNIVTRFLTGAGGGGGGGGRGGNAQPAAGPEYYKAWLAALPSLDFDKLSRNAQVDYLTIKRTSEMRIARGSVQLPPNPPRKQDNSGIPGAARGRDGLILDLTEQMIPYTPEQLMVLADKEFDWCVEEMKKASRQLGFGDDWKKAVEKVKDTYVPPGGQPVMIRDLLTEAVDYLRAKDLITVPQVAAESLQMSMMSPQQQLTSPFFLGGSRIMVSYPTDTMEFEARMQSMRGNNPNFSHATAHHEMIPGHNLVGFLSSRFNDYRPGLVSAGPFFGEGWPLYWELTLYDLGFNKTPEQRVGALFWRMHRSARIVFSFKFHMGQWSPQECIDYLVDKVGHERDNATAEVRRSFQGGYGPLYQAAYLLGGLQLRGLRREVVDSGQMTNKAFHDEIMRQGGMPIALLRLALTKQRLTRDMDVNWKFYGELPDK